MVRERRPEHAPWRRLRVARVDGQAPAVQMIREGRRRWVSLDAAMHAAFGTPPDHGPPPGVDVRPVPGFPGCEVGADFSLWHRPPDADYEAVGLPPPRRRLAATLGRAGVPAVRLDVGGRRVEVQVTRLVRAAFAPEELAVPAPPAPEIPPATIAGPALASAAPAVPAAGRPAGVEYRPVEGFPGYEVGSDYSVWSCLLTNGRGRGLPRPGEPVVWRRRAIQVAESGRRCLALWRDGKAHWVSVSEIRGEAFAPLLPAGRPGDESQVRGSAHGRARLDEEQVLEARRLKRQGWTYPALVERYRVGKVTLFYAITGKTWGHVPLEIGTR